MASDKANAIKAAQEKEELEARIKTLEGKLDAVLSVLEDVKTMLAPKPKDKR